jgi:uncharacterized protein YraI
MRRIARVTFLALPLFTALAFAACSSPQPSVAPSNSLTASAPTPTLPTLPTAVPDAPTRLVAEVVKSDALLRDGPGEAGAVINKLATGTLLTVLHPERGGPWYEVTYEAAGQSGWIHGSLIRFKTGVAPAPVQALVPKSKPTPAPTAAQAPAAEDDEDEDEDAGADVADSVKVWVNTNSDIYHCPGTRWYGNTKEGEYMTQAQAVAEGNRPAYGRKCY